MGLSVQILNVCQSIYQSKNEPHEILEPADGSSMSSTSSEPGSTASDFLTYVPLNDQFDESRQEMPGYLFRAWLDREGFFCSELIHAI